MSKYIDIVQWISTAYKRGYKDGAEQSRNDIVRCKDCKWRNQIGCALSIVDDNDKPKDDDYCSFGERIEE